MRKPLEKILAALAKLYIWRFHPKVVAITGSVGKTSTKEACAQVLRTKFRVRSSAGNFNNEIGMPLTILGEETAGGNLLRWVWIILKSLSKLIFITAYPEVLIVELGVDRPGNLSYLMKILGPIDVAVVTDIGISHLQFFADQSALAREKFTLIKKLLPTSMAVLNFDSPKVFEGRDQTKAQVLGFGFRPEAPLMASDFHLIQSGGNYGSNFKVHYQGTMLPFFLPKSLGKPGVYAALAASAVGLHFGINLVQSSEALKLYEPAPGRQRIISGTNDATIIDDTYNAAPASVVAALETLQALNSARKIVALGSMAELGSQTASGHRLVAAKIIETRVNLVFLVGDEAKIIQQELLKHKFSGRVSWFPTSEAASVAIKNALLAGDTILVKGSQSTRMEKIVKAIMADPDKAGELLVRQSGHWQD